MRDELVSVGHPCVESVRHHPDRADRTERWPDGASREKLGGLMAETDHTRAVMGGDNAGRRSGRPERGAGAGCGARRWPAARRARHRGRPARLRQDDAGHPDGLRRRPRWAPRPAPHRPLRAHQQTHRPPAPLRLLRRGAARWARPDSEPGAVPATGACHHQRPRALPGAGRGRWRDRRLPRHAGSRRHLPGDPRVSLRCGPSACKPVQCPAGWPISAGAWARCRMRRSRATTDCQWLDRYHMPDPID